MKLDIKRALASSKHKAQRGAPQPLYTPWGEKLNTAHVKSEHPKPQMMRSRWKSLNGLWEYAIVANANPKENFACAAKPKSFDGSICVPFSPEALLSGVGRQLKPDELLWYRCDFRVPRHKTSDHILLHFEGVDWACAIYVNGVLCKTHVGAYVPFSVDISKHIHAGDNELCVCVYDPSETGTQLRGKQRIDRNTMWYTAQSGIWQSVWLELMPKQYVASLDVKTSPDTGSVRLCVELNERDAQVEAVLLHNNKRVIAETTSSNKGVAILEFTLKDVKLWSPEAPELYDIIVRAGEDELQSYCAFRSATIEADDEGVPRFCLNHKPYFLRGVLNQGYWPDGLLTAPSDEAYIFDINEMKSLGFNLFRLHIKTESDRWYYLCDKLGMLVWQDMPSGGGVLSAWHTQQKPTVFTSSWGSYVDTTPKHIQALAGDDKNYQQEWLSTCEASVTRLSAHPSVVTWVLFNESWGQFKSEQATEMVQALDSTRPILATSGWYDQGAGDYLGIHNYFRPPMVVRDIKRHAYKRSSRALVTSEFGGLTWHIAGHTSFVEPYGYASYTTLSEWQNAVRTLLSATQALEHQGMCGYVYTQVSDVEEETNGLLTYDRRINKLALR